MPTQNEFKADPDGQAVMNVLTGLCWMFIHPRHIMLPKQCVTCLDARS